eukprot:scpid95086/ scgid34595/ 
MVSPALTIAQHVFKLLLHAKDVTESEYGGGLDSRHADYTGGALATRTTDGLVRRCGPVLLASILVQISQFLLIPIEDMGEDKSRSPQWRIDVTPEKRDENER